MITFEDFKKFVGEGETIIGIVFLLLTGVLYQIQIQKIVLSDYGGTLVIVFLMLALYYSIPFILLGAIGAGALEKLNKEKAPSKFYDMTTLSVVIYWGIKMWSEYKLLNFWDTYFNFLYWFIGIIVIIFFVDSIKSKFKKSNKK